MRRFAQTSTRITFARPVRFTRIRSRKCRCLREDEEETDMLAEMWNALQRHYERLWKGLNC
jgi:hypothetical protein